MSRAQVVMELFALTMVYKVVSVAGVTCKDMEGKDVDWYYVYKLPKIPTNPNTFIKEGVAFYYLDNYQQTFQLSKSPMKEQSQPVAQTLQQIYNQPQMIAYIMYNDHPPDEEEKFSWGHTKGVVAYDGSNGFWMIHSLPKFPRRDRYEWAENDSLYGQGILCVSFNSLEMENIAKQMTYNYPYVYSSNLPSDLLDIAPTFQYVVDGSHVTSPPWSHTVQLQSRGGQKFTHYAKFDSYGKDLYLDLVAQGLKGDLLVETWQKSNPIPSDCSFGYCVQNIKAIRFPSQGVGFSSSHEHSKWAVSYASKKVICVGDINREYPQFKRGGGTLCTNLPNVWQQYNNSVSKVEPFL